MLAAGNHTLTNGVAKSCDQPVSRAPDVQGILLCFYTVPPAQRFNMLTLILVSLIIASFGAGLLAAPSIKDALVGAWNNKPKIRVPTWVEGVLRGLVGDDSGAEKAHPSLYWGTSQVEARIRTWAARPTREDRLFAALKRAAEVIQERDATIALQNRLIAGLAADATRADESLTATENELFDVAARCQQLEWALRNEKSVCATLEAQAELARKRARDASEAAAAFQLDAAELRAQLDAVRGRNRWLRRSLTKAATPVTYAGA